MVVMKYMLSVHNKNLYMERNGMTVKNFPEYKSIISSYLYNSEDSKIKKEGIIGTLYEYDNACVTLTTL